ncbi:MAG: NUDIX domain-containing protein [Dehalococcoidales bacterium]|jgi:ADP-ribose pyrophosphatase|nr:NUDIX hydrolase [Dehalococcoidia bacterium]NCG34641.1 NUDIX domain-containing protein [Dehalococcoidales bacterium]
METKLVYKAESLEIRRDTYEMSNKHIIKKDFVDHPGSVMIIGIREKKILFVKQWRQPIRKYTIELPCGTLHKSEISKIGADREFREETGFSAKNYFSIGKFYCAPGYSNEVKEIFIAEDIFLSPLDPDEDEQIELQDYSLNEAIKLIKENKIIDQGTILALNIYKSIL